MKNIMALRVRKMDTAGPKAMKTNVDQGKEDMRVANSQVKKSILAQEKVAKGRGRTQVEKILQDREAMEKAETEKILLKEDKVASEREDQDQKKAEVKGAENTILDWTKPACH